MTTPDHPLRTAEEMLAAVLGELHKLGSSTEREGDVTYLLIRNVTARAAFEALRYRIPPYDPNEVTCLACEGSGTVPKESITIKPPPDSLHGGLRERIEAEVTRANSNHAPDTALVEVTVGLLRSCLAVLSSAAPKPVGDMVDGVFLPRCSFCHRKGAEAKRIISGISAAICDECAKLAVAVSQPSADDLVRAVRAEVHAALADPSRSLWPDDAAERAIRTCFDAARAEGRNDAE